MSRRSKKVKKLRILIVVFLILLVVTIISYKKIINKDKKDVVSININKNIDLKTDGVLDIGGLEIFHTDFTGELELSEIAKSLIKITEKHVPKIYNMTKDYNDSELTTFYNNNSNSIKNMVGIDNVNDFIDFCKKLQNRKIDLTKSYKLDVLMDTFEDESSKEGYAYSEYEVSYMDDSIIRFSIYVAKSSTISPQYIIGIK